MYGEKFSTKFDEVIRSLDEAGKHIEKYIDDIGKLDKTRKF